MRFIYAAIIFVSFSVSSLYGMDDSALNQVFKENKTQAVTRYDGKEWLRSEPKHPNPAWKIVVLKNKGWLYNDIIEMGNSLAYDYPAYTEKRRELTTLSKAGLGVACLLSATYFYLKDNETTD